MNLDAEFAKRSKMRIYTHFRVLTNLSTLWQTSRKEVIFFENKFVGVRGYGRVCFRKKQAMVHFFDTKHSFKYKFRQLERFSYLTCFLV